MFRLHRLAPAAAATLAAAALLAPTAQARPAISGPASGGGNAVVRVVHDQPLANPVKLPASGLNHGAGVVLDRTRATRITSSTSTDWSAVFTGPPASAIVIALFAAGLGMSRRANPAT